VGKCSTSVSHIGQQANALYGVTYAGSKLGCRAEPSANVLCLPRRSPDRTVLPSVPGYCLATGELMVSESQGGYFTPWNRRGLKPSSRQHTKRPHGASGGARERSHQQLQRRRFVLEKSFGALTQYFRRRPTARAQPANAETRPQSQSVGSASARRAAGNPPPSLESGRRRALGCSTCGFQHATWSRVLLVPMWLCSVQ
jgi:hypothetical protein